MAVEKKLIKNTLVYALGDIIPRIFTFFSFPILTSYLTPADYGIVSYVNTLTSVLMMLGFLCLNTYYLVEYYHQGSEVLKKRLLGNLSVFVVIINLFIVFFCLLFGNIFFISIKSDISFFPYIAIGIITHFFSLFSILPSALYRLQERPVTFTVINATRGLIQFILVIFLVVVMHYNAIGVLYTNLIVSIIFSVIFIFITFKHAIFCVDVKQIKVALRFSLPLLPGNIAYFLITMSDRLLIEKYLTLTDLGLYSTASTLALLLNILSYSVYKAVEPYFFKNYGTPNFITSFKQVQNIFLFALLLGVLGLSIFSREFLEVFANKNYNTAYYYVPLLLIGVFSNSLTMLYSTVITAQHKTKVNSLITIVGGILSVTLNILLLNKTGLLGASIVSSFAFSFILVLSVIFSKIKQNFFRPLCAILVCISIIYSLLFLLPVESLLPRFCIKIIVFFIAVLLCKFILKIDLYFFYKKDNAIYIKK